MSVHFAVVYLYITAGVDYPSTILPSGRSSAALRAGGGTLGIDSSVTAQSSLE